MGQIVVLEMPREVGEDDLVDVPSDRELEFSALLLGLEVGSTMSKYLSPALLVETFMLAGGLLATALARSEAATKGTRLRLMPAPKTRWSTRGRK